MSYGFLNKQGAASAGSSSADTPIVCETCLGPNPYVRMSKHHLGKECKVCGRPCTVFRWNPGSGMRFKTTEICTTCAKIRHVCQSCILDLDYHLPTQVRDAALGTSVKIPMSDINRQYFVNRMDALLDGASPEVTKELVGPSRAGHEVLKKLARPEPDYQQLRPVVCSFYARGNCARGQACPYKHENASSLTPAPPSVPHHAPGHVDMPVLKKADGAKALTAPPDERIRTLFFAGLPHNINQDELHTLLTTTMAALNKQKALASIQLVTSSHCAFVHFNTRQDAENMATLLANKVILQDHPIRVAWGRRPPPSDT